MEQERVWHAVGRQGATQYVFDARLIEDLGPGHEAERSSRGGGVEATGPSRSRLRGDPSRPYTFAMSLTLQDRIAGGFWGLLVGDALGVPYEFHPAEEIPPLEAIEMEPPRGFARAHEGVPPGTWSDDGAQALALLESLLHRRRLDLIDFGRRLVSWLDRGTHAVGGEVFDCGVQTRYAISGLRAGGDPRLTGPARAETNGNGSLMRVLPLVLWHTGTDRELVRSARRQSLPTHGHPRAALCCALYCLWARRLLYEDPAPWASAVEALYETTEPSLSSEVDTIVGFDGPLGAGYVVSTLHSARNALESGDYETVVKVAIAMGYDTDTTACVAGGLAGIRDGVGAIPDRWMASLRGKEIARPLLKRLLVTRAP